MTTFSLKDYYENLGVTAPKDEDEYSGGIPIPFVGWMKINEDIDREEREIMLREQMHIVNEEKIRILFLLMLGAYREKVKKLNSRLTMK